MIPIVIRYKAGDAVTTRAAYTGNIGLFECIWKILNTPDFHVEVSVLDPILGDNRHAICREASAAMSRAIGVIDPLAAVEAVRGTPAVKAEQGAQQVKAQDAAVNQIKEQGLS